MYIVSRGILTVVDAESGDKLKQLRLSGARQTGGRFGSLDYPSPVVIGDHLYYLNGSGQMFVFDIADEVRQVGVNQVTEDQEIFWGSPAVSDGRLLIRSSKHLYCVTDQGETVSPDAETVAAADTTPAENSRPTGTRGAGGDGGSRFDPMSMFAGMDANSDGSVTEDELSGNRMADRLRELDKDGDKAISREEFRSGIASLFRSGRGNGGNRGGGGGGGGYRGRSPDTRPDRPQRPQMDEQR